MVKRSVRNVETPGSNPGQSIVVLTKGLKFAFANFMSFTFDQTFCKGLVVIPASPWGISALAEYRLLFVNVSQKVAWDPGQSIVITSWV